MPVKEQTVREELAGLMDVYTGAVNRVASAYSERKNRQRNEQFLHPLTAAEMEQLEQDFRRRRIDPIPVFSQGAIA